jgi:hypothetical protein
VYFTLPALHKQFLTYGSIFPKVKVRSYANTLYLKYAIFLVSQKSQVEQHAFATLHASTMAQTRLPLFWDVMQHTYEAGC